MTGQRTGQGVAAIERRGTDVSAPHWLGQLMRPKRVPVDYKRSGRVAAGIGAPVLVGMLAGAPAIGALVALGALSGSLAATSGAYRDRARRMLFVLPFVAGGYFVGGLAAGHGWWTAVVVVAIAAFGALISSAGNNASFAGLQMLVFGIVGTGKSAAVSPLLALGCFVVGGAWAILLSIGAWPVRGVAPERGMVADIYDELAVMLAGIGTDAAHPARGRLTTALNTAYDVLLDARSRLSGRDRAYRRLLVLLGATTPVVEASVALVNARHRPPQTMIAAVTATAAAVRADEPAPHVTLPLAGSPRILALDDALRGVFALLDGGDADGPDRRTRPGLRARLLTGLDNIVGGPAAWLFALRLVVCMTVAEVLTMVIPLERSYWVALTTAIVLKPDFGSVFARAVLRGGGTVVGVLLGAVVLVLQPNGILLAVLIAVVGAALPIGQARNYGMFTTFVTPLVILLQDLTKQGNWALVQARLLDTLLGCAIVLVFGYLLWPGSRKPRLGPALAAAMDNLARYLATAGAADRTGRSTLRRRAYRSLSDLRTDFQRLITEPSAAGRQVSAWWPAMVALERAADATTRLAVELDAGLVSVPRTSDLDQLVAVLTELAVAVREDRQPRRLPLPPDPQLNAVMNELAAVHRAVVGPDLPDRGPLRVVRGWLPGHRDE